MWRLDADGAVPFPSGEGDDRVYWDYEAAFPYDDTVRWNRFRRLEVSGFAGAAVGDAVALGGAVDPHVVGIRCTHAVRPRPVVTDSTSV
ncbi:MULTISPECIES: hypothetical protein [unclassified Streptomyces]|uniref:hypothetical protein n=1 Tax=unclassified Streptomyces TaxID=2593676 RepID=UPI00131A0039|nr:MULTISPECIES: hypothetical protein [unclassified Streptomyces]